MSHPLPLDSFRARRSVLDPDDFALSDGKADPPPHDLVDKEVWRGLTVLPTYVSIRTSNDYGWLLKSEYELSSEWVIMVAEGVEREPEGWGAMGDVGDELYAATFEMLHGFYRQATRSLRSSLELILDASSKALAGVPASRGDRFSFTRCAEAIRDSTGVHAIDDKIESVSGKRLFGRIGERAGNGWIGDLYHRLSEYAHARPGRTLADTWQSNGPIFVGVAVQDFHALFVETLCAVSVVAGLSRSTLTLSDGFRVALQGAEVELDT